jgi:hypothetical protein
MGSANYNIAGAFMAVVTLIALPFLNTKKKYINVSIGKIGIIVLIIGIAVTQSRSAFAAFLLGLLINANNKSKKTLLYTFLAIIFVGVIFFTFFSDYWLGPMIKETVTRLPEAIPLALQYGEYSPDMDFSINVFGAAMRAVGIREAVMGFIQFPLFGVGFFGFSNYAPHIGTAENFFLQFLCETGIFGFVGLFIYLRSIWLSTKMKFQENSFAGKYQRGFRSAFVALIIVNVTGTLFYDTRIWGLLLVLSAIQIRLVWDERRRLKDKKIIIGK